MQLKLVQINSMCELTSIQHFVMLNGGFFVYKYVREPATFPEKSISLNTESNNKTPKMGSKEFHFQNQQKLLRKKPT